MENTKKEFKKGIPYGGNFMVKGINDKLYAYLICLGTSPEAGQTILHKFYIQGKHSEHAEKLGITRQRFARDFKSLISKGFIKETRVTGIQGNLVDVYEFVLGNTNPFKLIPEETLRYLINATNDHVIKTYVYLLNKHQWKQETNELYSFDYKELVEKAMGLKNDKYTNLKARDILNALYKLGLIDFEQFYQPNLRNCFRLKYVNLDYSKKQEKTEEKLQKRNYTK